MQKEPCVFSIFKVILKMSGHFAALSTVPGGRFTNQLTISVPILSVLYTRLDISLFSYTVRKRLSLQAVRQEEGFLFIEMKRSSTAQVICKMCGGGTVYGWWRCVPDDGKVHTYIVCLDDGELWVALTYIPHFCPNIFPFFFRVYI